LQNAVIGFVDTLGVEASPVTMQALDTTNKVWQLSLPENAGGDSLARLALKANNAFYFAETSMQFSEYRTTFNKDFRKTN